MLQRCLTTISLVFYYSFYAQVGQPAGARSMSLVNASVTLTDVWSFHHNPGALAQLKQTSAGISYENRYMLKELQTQAFAVAHPLKNGVISFGAKNYGYRIYRSARIGAGYSMKLGEKLAAGIQLNYQGLRIENYGSKGTVTAEAGLLAKINNQVSLGFSIMNLGRSRLTDFQDERFKTFMRLGIQYKVSSKVLTIFEVEKDVRSVMRAKGAVEYELADQFFMRAGCASASIEIAFGFGYRFKNELRLDMGSAWLQRLGWSPNVGLSYDFKWRKYG